MSCDIERRKSFDSQRRHPTLPSMNGWLYRSRRLHAIHKHAQNFGIRHVVQTTAESDLRADLRISFQSTRFDCFSESVHPTVDIRQALANEGKFAGIGNARDILSAGHG